MLPLLGTSVLLGHGALAVPKHISLPLLYMLHLVRRVPNEWNLPLNIKELSVELFSKCHLQPPPYYRIWPQVHGGRDFGELMNLRTDSQSVKQIEATQAFVQICLEIFE